MIKNLNISIRKLTSIVKNIESDESDSAKNVSLTSRGYRPLGIYSGSKGFENTPFVGSFRRQATLWLTSLPKEIAVA
jgi:hypothetical protein